MEITSKKTSDYVNSAHFASENTPKNTSKEILNRNFFIINEMNNIGDNIVQNMTSLDSHDSKNLASISIELKNISESIHELSNNLIDKQDTSIKRAEGNESVKVSEVEQNVSEPKEKQSLFSKILSFLASLFGLSGSALLGLLGDFGNFLKNPVKWVTDVIKNNVKKFIEPFAPVFKFMLHPVDTIIGGFKNKWNKMTNFIVNTLNTIPGVNIKNNFLIEDKLKVTDTTKDKVKISDQKMADKPAVTRDLVDNRPAKSLKQPSAINRAYNYIKNTGNTVIQKGLGIFDYIRNALTSAWDSACSAALEGKRKLSSFITKKAESLVSAIFKKLPISNKFKIILEAVVKNIDKIRTRLAKQGLKIFSKAIPGAGFLIGIYMAWDKFKEGQFILGALSAISAVISLLPGLGAVVSICLDILIEIAAMYTKKDNMVDDINNMQIEANNIVIEQMNNANNSKLYNKDLKLFESGITENSSLVDRASVNLVSDSNINSSPGLTDTPNKSKDSSNIQETKPDISATPINNTYQTTNVYNSYNSYNNSENSTSSSSSGGSASSKGSKAAAEFSEKYNKGYKNYTGSCAKYVRSYLMAAGYPLDNWPVAAADYVKFLPKYGFTQVKEPAMTYSPREGDISITNRFGKHRYGHIAIFNGSQWVSDAEQGSISIYNDINAYGGPNKQISIWRDTTGQTPSDEMVVHKLSNMDKSFKDALKGMKNRVTANSAVSNASSPEISMTSPSDIKETVADISDSNVATVSTSPSPVMTSPSTSVVETKSANVIKEKDVNIQYVKNDSINNSYAYNQVDETINATLLDAFILS